MKKFAKWLGVFAVVVCLGAAMLACGGELEGKYSHSETKDGVTAKATIELKKDNKCTVSMSYKNVPADMAEYMKDTSIDGTYAIDGDKITITISEGDNETTMTGTIKKGKSITMGEGDKAVTYKK